LVVVVLVFGGGGGGGCGVCERMCLSWRVILLALNPPTHLPTPTIHQPHSIDDTNKYQNRDDDPTT
jgi:hypothetical protein